MECEYEIGTVGKGCKDEKKELEGISVKGSGAALGVRRDCVCGRPYFFEG